MRLSRYRRRLHSKDHSELVHFQNRCMERVGQIINQKVLKEHCFGKHHKGTFLSKQSLTRSKHLYTHTDGRKFTVVYDKKRNRFVTIFPFVDKDKQ